MYCAPCPKEIAHRMLEVEIKIFPFRANPIERLLGCTSLEFVVSPSRVFKGWSQPPLSSWVSNGFLVSRISLGLILH